jgi:hypothetical protein
MIGIRYLSFCCSELVERYWPGWNLTSTDNSNLDASGESFLKENNPSIYNGKSS